MGGWGVSAFRILWALWLRGILCSRGSRVLEGFRVWGGVNIRVLTITYTILGVPACNSLQIAAGRGGCCQPLIRFQEVL